MASAGPFLIETVVARSRLRGDDPVVAVEFGRLDTARSPCTRWLPCARLTDPVAVWRGPAELDELEPEVEECVERWEAPVSACATAGLLATAMPTPSVNASAPTRPMYRA